MSQCRNIIVIYLFSVYGNEKFTIMKTMRKEELDKAAWNWVDTTDSKSVTQFHVELAYRISLNVCKPNSCRYDGKNNLFLVVCINRLIFGPK